MKKIIILIFLLFSVSVYAAPVQVSNEGYFQSWPSMTVFNGDIYVCYSVRSAHGVFDPNAYVKVRKSTDGLIGATWTNIATFNNASYDDAGCNLTTLNIGGTPTIFLSWETYYDNGYTQHTGYVTKSTNGMDWGSAKTIASGSLGGNYYYAGAKGRIIKVSNGDLLAFWAAYYYTASPFAIYINRIYVSRSIYPSNGDVWETPIIVTDCPTCTSDVAYMSETSGIELKHNGNYDGDVMALVRKDVDNPESSTSGWWAIYSADYGATWGTVTSNRVDSGLTDIDSYWEANPADIIRITGDTIISAFDTQRGGPNQQPGTCSPQPACRCALKENIYIRYSTAENVASTPKITWNNVNDETNKVIEDVVSYCDGGYATAAELTTCGDIGFVFYEATAANASNVWFLSKTRAGLGLPTTCTSGGSVILTSGGGQAITGSGGKFITP
jgi:hypothetical protein